MSTRALCALLVGMGLLGANVARAEERPNEDEMFGGGKTEEKRVTDTETATTRATTTARATTTTAASPLGGFGTDSPPHQAPSASRTPVATTKSDGPSSGEQARDELMLGTPGAGPKLSDEVAPEDPLRIGGQIYLRGQVSALQGQAAGDYTLSSPSLLDVYMDVRPNDRVRGYVLGRMSFDPTLPQTADSVPDLNIGTQGGFSKDGVFGGKGTRTPKAVLDQMWLRFDIKHRVFVTAGRQHVRWGTGHFWMPTDYLHIQRRNPLDVFDSRTGTNMVKLHIPWEDCGCNFYAYGINENIDATSTASKVAGAARVEVALGTSELGAGVFAQRGLRPKLAADLSTGIWDLDFYGEVAVRFAQDIDRVSFDRNVDSSTLSLGPTPASSDAAALAQYLGPAIDKLYPFAPFGSGSEVKVQATGGVSYSIKYADKDIFTLGAEYFYNGLGYNDKAVYLGLILPHSQSLNEPASFFYLGRHYAGVYATAPSPYSWDNTTFTLSTLSNLSDHSGITRFDYSLVLLTHLRLEAFGAVHWGERKGEFRFATDTIILGNLSIQGRSPSLFDLGLGLRLAI
jgi:hypothetical protein